LLDASVVKSAKTSGDYAFTKPELRVVGELSSNSAQVLSLVRRRRILVRT